MGAGDRVPAGGLRGPGRALAAAGIFLAALPGAAADACAPVVAAETPRLAYRVAAEHPHRRDAFTQGLVWDRGALVEGTGLYGRSSLAELDLASGAVARGRALPDDRFGEGLAVLGGRVYQLTWKAGEAFVYDRATLAPRGRRAYEGEGWGLASDGERLLMSDGSALLRWRDPRDFRVLGAVTVRSGGRPVPRLNELEWVGGAVYANVWMTDCVVRIDPAGGAVTGALDLSPLRARLPPLGRDAVANGIAHRDDRGTLLVTGKRWPRLFELDLGAGAPD